ncbi:hypothetical protein Bca52824_002362 [Brassica carinata]|uniref:DUF1985 domain-containing protein n=1 Tax=Brassica carinata TaxID=52824 RepID=A0A8X8BET2_BRACI|nr:hypothetical protein Bca52824_002362 [Brassica carinata]
MENMQLPDRMFAAGHEPNGERVNTYHKPKRIKSIIEALDPEEIEFLRNTTFGKIIAQAENPSFSGSFGQFKKHEIWFLFCGKPVRMSLHEFAHRKKKNPINEKLYWGELFGSLKSCQVDLAIEMLKKRAVKDREMRLKYACLAFTSSVLLPTSHFPRIIPEHVEMIRDMDEFLAYPWGRVSFEMLVTGIKKKDEILLSQTSIALPGFVDAIQFVFIAAVPHIKEVIPLVETVVVIESDSDRCNRRSGDTKPEAPTAVVRFCVNPAHGKTLDEEGKVSD